MGKNSAQLGKNIEVGYVEVQLKVRMCPPTSMHTRLCSPDGLDHEARTTSMEDAYLRVLQRGFQGLKRQRSWADGRPGVQAGVPGPHDVRNSLTSHSRRRTGLLNPLFNATYSRSLPGSPI